MGLAMADEGDSAKKAGGKRLVNRPGLIKALLPPMPLHSSHKAGEWAKDTLRRAGLPNEAGLYTLQPDGKIVLQAMQGQAVRLHADDDGTIGDWFWPTSERPEVWAGGLPSAVECLGYGPDTPERIAAELVQLLSDLSSALDRGEAEKAASIAFYAGMCWQKQFNDKAAKAGAGLVKTRRMGARARTKYDEETKREWFLEALRLEEQQGIATTHKQAAQLIKAGRGYGASVETIRKAIDTRKARMRKK
jgi:hypothetical protein